MNLTKDNRTGHYRASFRTVDGKRRSISTRTSNRQEAQRIVKASGLKELETAARVGRLTNEAISLITTGRKITMEKAIEPWLDCMKSLGRSSNTLEQSRQIVQRFCREAGVGHQSPACVTRAQVDAFINAPSKVKAGSRKTMLSTVRMFFWYVAAEGWRIGDPSQLVEVNMGLLTHAQKEPAIKEIFTDGQVWALIAAAPPESFWRAAIAIGRWTGLRLSDVAGLEWASLEKPGKIIVWTQKRDRRVELPLEPESLQRAVASIKKEDAVYCFPKECEIVMDPKRRSLLSVQFGRLCKACGIANKSFHNLRHTRLTELVEAGMSLSDAALVAGHSSTRSTQGYIH